MSTASAAAAATAAPPAPLPVPPPPAGSASAEVPVQQASRPIVVGSCAYWRGKEAEESKSHEWTVYVRAASPDEDPGLFIKRVVFQLHPTITPSTRTVEAPPFEVTEQGWGEFEVYYHGGERAVDFSHLLKLYPEAEELRAASRRRIEMEEEIRQLRAEPAD
ncbi:hypothetical protein EMIHUDRAFT_105587 [Emiliania huxleyi CCMP1516]|uniref:YEATS domain-containing protein n=2 Tax=Emiliania huxleyi TaxID=2903 RepID=A0A0D3ID57_EMIH1|nr:hypothetical protein EMIHUDRAFT_105587 [Emiliania huxleyi CCMP1516]EOD09192.1 hypothetical protein EMIHUDRAFT_105587 [Emiliania huxleyi CCMP1516]|eukprot:XP_005761621.1 hypothetical protein EMIHUDRAFT_105587 [Emiliania huxleyi CCMP1516]